MWVTSVVGRWGWGWQMRGKRAQLLGWLMGLQGWERRVWRVRLRWGRLQRCRAFQTTSMIRRVVLASVPPLLVLL